MIIPYVQIARPDHWFKNIFMLAGVVLAYFYEMAPFSSDQIWLIPLGVLRDLHHRVEQLRDQRDPRCPE